MIQARELAQAELALARHKIELQKAAEGPAATACPPSCSGTSREEGADEVRSQELAIEGDTPLVAPARKKKKQI
jgi:hypothetical protein